MALTPTPGRKARFLGNFYQCKPVSADLVVADSGNWLLHGIVTDGQKLAGVFSAGTQWWICGVDPGCAKPGVDAPAVVRTISAITNRLLDAYAQCPAGGQHPAVDNLQQLHLPGASAPIPVALPNALVPN